MSDSASTQPPSDYKPDSQSPAPPISTTDNAPSCRETLQSHTVLHVREGDSNDAVPCSDSHPPDPRVHTTEGSQNPETSHFRNIFPLVSENPTSMNLGPISMQLSRAEHNPVHPLLPPRTPRDAVSLSQSSSAPPLNQSQIPSLPSLQQKLRAVPPDGFHFFPSGEHFLVPTAGSVQHIQKLRRLQRKMKLRASRQKGKTGAAGAHEIQQVRTPKSRRKPFRINEAKASNASKLSRSRGREGKESASSKCAPKKRPQRKPKEKGPKNSSAGPERNITRNSTGSSRENTKTTINEAIGCSPKKRGSSEITKTVDFSIEEPQRKRTAAKPRNVRAQAAGKKVTNGTGALPKKKTNSVRAAVAEIVKDGNASTSGSKQKLPVSGPSAKVLEDVVSHSPTQKQFGDMNALGKAKNSESKRIAQLEKQVMQLKWEVLNSAARDREPEESAVENPSVPKRVQYYSAELAGIASIAECWSRAVREYPPWEIRSKISTTSQTRVHLSLQSLYNHVIESIKLGTTPPCNSTFQSLQHAIISTLRTATKADFAHTPKHATVVFAMSKMTLKFLDTVFTSLLKASSNVDLCWSISVVQQIVAPILRFSKSESEIVFADVSKCCVKAIVEAALLLTPEEGRPPQVQVELSLRAIELSMAILSLEEKRILSEIPAATVCSIGSRNILFSLRFAVLNAK